MTGVPTMRRINGEKFGRRSMRAWRAATKR